jgi:uracil-DNA glycosylase family 4
MTKKQINQNDSYKNELLNSMDNEYIFESAPISRIKNKIYNSEDKLKSLDKLKNKISSIEDCKLKENASNLVFSDGSIDSQIMIVGEGPGQKEDELSKPFVGDAGMLLNKMLKAININRKDIYITNVVNYRPPNNRKPEPNEILRYSNFLREHIAIINPKILILMGSTAMESLLGSKNKISKERGKWKEVIINNSTYLTMVTFHPAYLLRQADQKKYSWADLKVIRKKIDELEIKF